MYSILDQAYQRASMENGELLANQWSEKPIDVISQYINITERGSKRFTIVSLSGAEYISEGGPTVSYLKLVDGGVLLFTGINGYFITGDLNSKLVLNKNIFPFAMVNTNRRLDAMDCGEPTNPQRLYSGNKSNGCPPSALRWILTNDNMDYKYCPDKLIWGKKVTCK